jgi:hypothetical protein
MQPHEPLTFLHVTLSSWNILRSPRIHQVHFQTVLLQNIMHRDPVHPSGLHHYRAYATAHQPLRHFYQRSGPRPELAHRLRVPPARYGYVVAFVTHINTGRVSVHNLQSRICGTQTLLDISALFAIQSPPSRNRSKADSLTFAMACSPSH